MHLTGIKSFIALLPLFGMPLLVNMIQQHFRYLVTDNCTFLKVVLSMSRKKRLSMEEFLSLLNQLEESYLIISDDKKCHRSSVNHYFSYYQ